MTFFNYISRQTLSNVSDRKKNSRPVGSSNRAYASSPSRSRRIIIIIIILYTQKYKYIGEMSVYLMQKIRN